MTPRRNAPWVVALALSLAPALASAQADDAAFERSFDEGLRALDARRFADAVRAFDAARALHDWPRVRYNLALAARGAGRYRLAIESFARYLAEPDPADPPDRVARVRAAVDEMRALLVHLRVTATPADATLSLDGAPVPDPSAALELDPGRHVLAARAPGHVDWERALDLRPGADERVDLRLELAPPDARVVVVPSVASAAVLLDGIALGRGTVERRVEPGDHTVEIRADGHAPFRRTVRVGRTGVVRVDASLAPVVRALRWWIPAVAVGGAALVAGGVALTLWLTRGEEPYAPTPWGTFREQPQR